MGGIANITVRRDGEVLAWDIGPANALVDAAVAGLTGGAEVMDVDGARAARGRIRDDLLPRLLDEPYYALPAPKSTGKELFHATYVRDLVASAERDSGVPVDPDDLVATLTELTAELVGRACRADALRELVVAGGGVRNPVLMARMRERCAPTVLTAVDEYGLPSAAKEAYMFALLSFLTWHGLPATIPSATGASAPALLGSITPGSGPLRLPDPVPTMPRRLVVVPG